MKNRRTLSLNLTFIFCITVLFLHSSFDSVAKTPIDSPVGIIVKEKDIVNETILEILQVEIYPPIAIVNQLVCVNITIKNNGQFTMAELENLKVETTMNVSKGELYLEGSLSGLAPGEMQVARINLTFLQIGFANVTFTFSADNIQDTSTTIQIQVIDENNTTTLFFEYIPILFCIVLLSMIFLRKKKGKDLKLDKLCLNQ
ncbi:MAG: hypothetical protein ACTSQF_14570 [Candidatus Heimdallarchaeaceae archaeon]